jgi:hypothetical protein
MPRPSSEIAADLAEAYAARRRILATGAQSTTMGGQSFQAVSLSELQAIIAALEGEAKQAAAAEAGDTGGASGFAATRIQRNNSWRG